MAWEFPVQEVRGNTISTTKTMQYGIPIRVTEEIISPSRFNRWDSPLAGGALFLVDLGFTVGG